MTLSASIVGLIAGLSVGFLLGLFVGAAITYNPDENEE